MIRHHAILPHIEQYSPSGEHGCRQIAHLFMIVIAYQAEHHGHKICGRRLEGIGRLRTNGAASGAPALAAIIVVVLLLIILLLLLLILRLFSGIVAIAIVIVDTAATATATALHKAGIVINPLQIERLTLNHEPSPQHENHPHGTPPGAHFGATPWRYADTAAVISGEVVVLVALAIQQKVLILLVAHHVLRQKQLARRGDVEGIGTDSSPALTTTAAPVRNFAPTSARVGAVRQVGHAGAGEDRAVGQIEGRFRHRRRRGGACWTCCRAPMFAGHPWQLVGRWGGNVQRLLARWRCHCRTFDSFAAACCV
mmetsp:Transcript_14036/g.40297  ORF Transcript_14036/g.40297 Transcript_14036/m.40297 type:complete len:311 (-) Transcript_14036:94-1026(-)